MFQLDKLLVFDGAMGTMLQSKGFTHSAIPEELNIDENELIVEIHREYIAKGAEVVTTNTFGANAYKLKPSKYSVQEVISAAIDAAQSAAEDSTTLVALDIGPIGRIMKPIGDLDFDTAYEYFKEQVVVGNEKNVDLILIETMSDLGEMRAAVLAAKENADCPVFATMTFEKDGISLTGTDPENMILALEALNVDAIGVNCSLGPKDLLPIVRRILNFTNLPVIVQANAGLPSIIDEKTIFSIDIDEFVKYYDIFVSEGVSIIGGCCGTTPEYIEKISQLKSKYFKKEMIVRENYLSSSQKRVSLDDHVTIIGERINPSGNKNLKLSFQKQDIGLAVKMAFEQVEAGAHVLDVCTSLPGVDKKKLMLDIIEQFNGLISAPLQFDSTDPEIIESALRHYNGVAIVNSVNGKASSMEAIFPLVKKYGAHVVALTFDEEGIPKHWEKRVEIAQKMITTAKKYGIEEEKLLIDCLVLTASAQQESVMETLKAIQYIKSHFKVKTTLGLSNVSYGLPNRPLLNRTYLAMALNSGLDTVIIDPGAPGVEDTLLAFNVLNNHDQDSMHFIEKYSDEKKVNESQFSETLDLKECLLKGYKDDTKKIIITLLKDYEPLDIVNRYLITALDEIGRLYEIKKIYLPQLIRAAETASIAFAQIRESIDKSDDELESKGKIILATVEGDVHDLGKNLVKVLLENYGYQIIDLGKDVSSDAIIESIVKNDVKLVGLSALMTTTVANMEKTITELRKQFSNIEIFVGGAVLTEDYALKIGADNYGKDARSAITIANDFFKQK